MKIILKEDVKALGKKGQVCIVSDGYARNYLIPRGLAIEATQGNVQDLAQKQKQETLKKEKEKLTARELAVKIENISVKIKVKAGDKGKLFGSVTNKEISEVLEKEYLIKLDKRKIELKEPVKATGEYSVPVRIHPDITAILKVEVEPLDK